VVAAVPNRWSRLRHYRGRYYRGRYRVCPAARLRRRLSAGALAVILGLSTGACSFSYQLDNLFSKKDDLSSTGALQPIAAIKPLAGLPPEGDLVIARAAVSEVLNKGAKDASVPWENPKTGARGTVTPIASAYSQDGLTCREFLASYVREGSESWLQGEACRASASKGKWEVRNLKPWQRT
jgi:hypothetical protein